MTAFCLRGIFLLGMACMAWPCPGQGVVEYGTATASKGAAAPAAKKLGDGLGAILKKAGSALETTQKGSGGTVSSRVPLQSASVAAGTPAAKSKPANEKEPTAEEFDKVTAGMTSEELLTMLGKPAFRVVLPEDGRLVELCEYSVKGRPLGSVRMVDGKVAEVRRASQ